VKFASYSVAKTNRLKPVKRQLFSASRCTATRLLRHTAVPDNYWLHIIRKTKHFRWWNYSTICAEWAAGHFGLSLT